MSVALEKEMSVYAKKLAEFAVSHQGKYVLIHGEDVVDFFSSYDDAIKAGYDKFGLAPFLVKQVQALEQIHLITRLVGPCSTRATAV